MPGFGSTLLRWLLPVLAGAMFIPGLAPFGLWPLTLVSMALLLFLLHRTPQASGFLTGWLYGAGFFGAGASWVYVSIHVHGHAPAPLAAVMTACFCLGLAVLTGMQTSLYLRLAGPGPIPRVLVFAALWVLFEWLRSWLLTGFPWLYAGYTTLHTPAAGWAPVLGVFGQGFLVAVLAGCLAGVALDRQQRRTWGIRAALLVAVSALGFLMGKVDWTRPHGDPVTVALYQPNIPQEQKWNPLYFRSFLDQYERATKPALPGSDIVLWPESAIPAYRDTAAPFLERMEQAAAAAESTLITGIPTRDDSGRYNSIIALGSGTGEYRKQKLVPFGEYVPLEEWLRGLIEFFDLPMSSFTAGPNVPPVLQGQGLNIAAFICYEVVYPDFVWRGASSSELLVTVSNDSWFGRSAGPFQHLEMAQFRALETGRPALRGTNNGVSAIIDHRGGLSATAPQYTQQLLTGRVQPRTGLTPVMLWGSAPTLLFCALLLAVAAYRRYR